jgi:hypothetical protein
VASQADSQLIQRIEPQIAELADKGRHSKEDYKVDLDLLTRVPLVQAQLAGLDGDARNHPDAQLIAILDALEMAIETLPERPREAALDHFGYTEPDPDNQALKGEREKRAVKAWGFGVDWYRKAKRKYFGMKPSEYVIALATCALCGVAKPVDYIAQHEGIGGDGAGAVSADASTVVGPTAIGERASRGATIVSRDPGHLEVFWIGPNNEVFYRWWLRDKGWSDEDFWAEPAAVSLTAVSREPEDEVLFGLAPDGHVWYRIWELNDKQWHVAGEVQWFDDDDVVRGPLASASRGPDMIELFAFDADGQPLHRWTEGGMNWSPWTSEWRKEG